MQAKGDNDYNDVTKSQQKIDAYNAVEITEELQKDIPGISGQGAQSLGEFLVRYFVARPGAGTPPQGPPK